MAELVKSVNQSWPSLFHNDESWMRGWPFSHRADHVAVALAGRLFRWEPRR